MLIGLGLFQRTTTDLYGLCVKFLYVKVKYSTINIDVRLSRC